MNGAWKSRSQRTEHGDLDHSEWSMEISVVIIGTWKSQCNEWGMETSVATNGAWMYRS
jgi:hypothetical protein